MGYEVLKETPLSVEKMSNLDGIIWAENIISCLSDKTY